MAGRPIRLGLKYCGGCNPRYDRRAAVEALAGAHPELQLCPLGEGGGWDGVLLVQGCPVGCAKLSGGMPPPVFTLTGEEDPRALEEWLRGLP